MSNVRIVEIEKECLHKSVRSVLLVFVYLRLFRD